MAKVTSSRRPTRQLQGSPAETAAPEALAPAASWRRRHLLDLDDFSAAELELVMETADTMKEVLSRDVPRLPTLRGRTVINLFYENSTRTRSSFELAAKSLGADVINISAASSSVKKGESLVDTVLTVQAVGADVIVIRHSASGAPYLAARTAKCRVVNAGDGWHAHPTQGLLDLYTIRSQLGEVRGRKVVIVGDITHSRVARSDFWGLTSMGAEVVICGPPTLLPAELGGIHSRNGAEERDLPPVRVELDLDRAIDGADAVITLRLQRERQHAGLIPSLREYCRLFQVTSNRMARAKPGAFVMHPGPVNEGVEISAELAHGARSFIEQQVSNGVAVRMAVLYLLLSGEKTE